MSKIADEWNTCKYDDFEAWSMHCVPVSDIAEEFGEDTADEYLEWMYSNEK